MADPIAVRMRPPEAIMQQPGRSPVRRYFGGLLCIALSGLFLYLAMRNADLREVWETYDALNLHWLPAMIGVGLIDFWLRAVRWSWMFPSEFRPTARQCFSIFMIGTLTNNLVPGRLGDIARAGMISRLAPSIGSSGAFATVVLEKVVDGLMLLALLGVALLIAPLPAWLGQAGALGLLLFLAMLSFLLMVNARSRTNSTEPESAAEQSRFRKIVSAMQKLLKRFALGLNALNSKKQTFAVLVLTLAIWLLEFAFMFLVFQVFGLNLTFLAAMVTTVILSVGMMLPAAPGAIGTYQFFAVTGLRLYNVPESLALATAVFLNVFVFANSTVLGLLALSAEGMNWLSPWRARPKNVSVTFDNSR